jgi:hypothetical protein
MSSASTQLVLQVPRPELLSQPKLLDLARRSARELADDSDRLRPLLPGEMASREVRAHLLQRRRSRALPHAHDGCCPLAEASIRFGDHGDFGNDVDAQEDLLHLLG